MASYEFMNGHTGMGGSTAGLQELCFFRTQKMKPQPVLKKRKVDADAAPAPAPAPSLRTSSTRADDKDSAKTLMDKLMVPVVQSSITLKIQQAKNFAIAQAQQEGCTGNYRIFDSPFGNFLVPVIPTRAELNG